LGALPAVCEGDPRRLPVLQAVRLCAVAVRRGGDADGGDGGAGGSGGDDVNDADSGDAAISVEADVAAADERGWGVFVAGGDDGGGGVSDDGGAACADAAGDTGGAAGAGVSGVSDRGLAVGAICELARASVRCGEGRGRGRGGGGGRPGDGGGARRGAWSIRWGMSFSRTGGCTGWYSDAGARTGGG